MGNWGQNRTDFTPFITIVVGPTFVFCPWDFRSFFVFLDPGVFQNQLSKASPSVQRKSWGFLPPKTSMSPENQWLKNVISCWNDPFLGDMLVFGRVLISDLSRLEFWVVRFLFFMVVCQYHFFWGKGDLRRTILGPIWQNKYPSIQQKNPGVSDLKQLKAKVQ